MLFKDKKKIRKALNLTPLIDVIFLLIVFFMLSTSFISTSVIDLNLASKDSHENTSIDNKALLVKITADNKIIIEEDIFAFDLLQVKLNPYLEKDLNKQILLLPRPGVNVQTVINVIDYLKDIGVQNFSLIEES